MLRNVGGTLMALNSCERIYLERTKKEFRIIFKGIISQMQHLTAWLSCVAGEVFRV